MRSESAEEFGVASEQSGKVLGRACVQDGAVNGIQSLCTEDSAVPSDYSDAAIVSLWATRSAASRNILMEGKADMQVEYRGFRAEISARARVSLACKNMPVSAGSQQFSSR